MFFSATEHDHKVILSQWQIESSVFESDDYSPNFDSFGRNNDSASEIVGSEDEGPIFEK